MQKDSTETGPILTSEDQQISKYNSILHGFKSNKVAGEIEPEVDQDNLTEIKKTKEIPKDTTDNRAHPQYYICI